MSTVEAPAAPQSDVAETPAVGAWVDLPPQNKKNGPNSKFAAELNATARDQEDNPGKYRAISQQKSPRSASGRASTIKRKLRDGKVNGLEFDAKHFKIEARGSVVLALYDPPATKAEAPKVEAPKAEAPKAPAAPAAPRSARPDAKPGKAK